MPLNFIRLALCVCLMWAIVVRGSRADEAVPALRINGLSLEITRLSGAAGALRVATLESQWRSQPNTVLPWQQQGEWRVLAHRTGHWSEVLQVRGRDAGTEAFLSRLDVQRAPSPVPVLPLPPGCRARSTVESGARGDAVIQVTGPCIGTAAASRGSWVAALVVAGWRGGTQADGSVYRFRRANDELFVVFTGAAGAFTALQRHVAREDGS